MRLDERKYYSENENFVEYPVSVPKIQIFVDPINNVAAYFTGRKKKATWKFRFEDKAKMLAYIDDNVKRSYDSIKRKEDIKAKQKEEAVFRREKIKVGDVFNTSWGYNMTHVDFFEVVDKPSPARVIVREIAKTLEETGYGCGKTKPIPGEYVSKEKLVSINKYGNLSNLDKYGNSGYLTDVNREHHVCWMD